MKEQDRTILLMKFSGFRYKEKVLQIEDSSVGTLLARAKLKFRKLLNKWRGNK